MKPIVSLCGVSFGYGRERAIDDIHLDVYPGAFLSIVGPNGSGKSTLLKCMLGLLEPNEGEIKLFDTPLAAFHDWKRIGYVSQKSNSFSSGFPATVYEVVRSGLVGEKSGLPRFRQGDRNRVMDALKLVEMEQFVNRNIGQLSGGQQQRVFIARALVTNPELLILDEPTVGVDAQRVQQFYALLRKLNVEEGKTLILVTHDIGAISDVVTDVACIYQKLHFHGSSEAFQSLDDEALSGM
ncbi:MAG: metal ABC transporter ATP-binding protein, partial [Bacilli bacterium]